ncbi:MBL fold metallo-hydrolase [Bacillus haikouensis]|nr:MBL fold metallo-hydrolase [Bacillus haikouensis]
MIEGFTSKHFTLEKVSPHVYAAIAKEGGGSAANAGFVDLGDKVMVFDTFNTQQASEDLRYIAEKVTKHLITWVINSHWHGDHIRGNQTFNDRNIISSEITYSKMKEIHPSRISKQKNDLQGLSHYIESLSKKDDPALQKQIHFLRELERSLPTLKLTLPHQTFNGELTFFGTTCSAKLFSLGGGHSFCGSMGTVLVLPF